MNIETRTDKERRTHARDHADRMRVIMAPFGEVHRVQPKTWAGTLISDSPVGLRDTGTSGFSVFENEGFEGHIGRSDNID